MMISRVAESCFWLHRHVERAESVARLLAVNHFTVLDAGIHDAERWRPVVVVVGEKERFLEIFGPEGFNDDEQAEQYLTWDDRNPISIKASVFWARENARTIREVISREMWENINACWQWLNRDDARRTYRDNRGEFFQRVRSMAAEFQGVCHSTLLHEEPFDFMRLGMLMERANQTARVMDVKTHWLTSVPAAPGIENPQEAAQWAALLRLCAAHEPFLKRFRTAPTGPHVAEFLLKDMSFPRSVLHCFDRARNFLSRIHRSLEGRENPPQAMPLLLRMITRLKQQDVSNVAATDLHAELTHIIDTAAEVCTLIHADFFDPGPTWIASTERAQHDG